MSHRSDYTDRFRTDVDYRPQRRAEVGSGDGSLSANEISVAQILALIERATGTALQHPNYGLNLQIADLVNEKKGQAPREVAMKLAKLAYPTFNKRAILALSVLDVCVKNCGYPFHLAISRRDFLNLLVRSFQQQPPLNYSHLQNLILQMLQEWELGLVKNSKYRDDLMSIRDMNRLLQHKGYIFPEVSMQDVAALTPMEDSLKSAAELEKEDQEVQSAKLHELIRSGTPEDLKEANRLMSLMAGFRESRIDYHAKMAAELDKVRRKAELFAEMLQSGEKPDPESRDVFEELRQALKSALPKVRHILNDKDSMEEDEEAHAKILNLKAQIEAVLQKYEAIMTNDPNAGSMEVPTFGGKTSAKFASLIDIGEDDQTETTSKDGGADLLELSLGGLSLDTNTSKQMSTSDILQLGRTETTSTRTPAATSEPDDPFAAFTSTPSQSSATPVASKSVQIFSDSAIIVEYSVHHSPESTEFEFVFSNTGTKRISNLETQYAPPKSLKLEIGVVSITSIEPKQQAKQKVVLVGSGTPKLRWKVTYKYGLDDKTAGGDLKDI